MSLILKYDLGNPHRLPVGYTPLAYIESSGTLWIDTGWIPNNNSKIISEFESLNKESDSDNYYPITCIRTSDFKLIFEFFINKNKSSVALSANGSESVVYSNFSGKLFVTQTTDKTICNGVTLINSTKPTIETSYNCILLGYNNQGTINPRHMSCKLYKFRGFDGNVLSLDYIPAKRNSDGVVGMFDIVSQTFKTNDGTGEFIAGPEVVVLPYEYLLVEYVGNQYINNNLIPCYRRSDLLSGIYDITNNTFLTNSETLGPVVEESSRQLEYNNAGSSFKGIPYNVHHSISNPSSTLINLGSGDFDGTSSIIIADSPSENVRSVSFWMNINNLNDTYLMPFVDYKSRLCFGRNNNTENTYLSATSSSNTYPFNFPLNTNTWYHVVVINTGSSNTATGRQLYINGILLTQNTSGTVSYYNSGEENKLNIGLRKNSSNSTIGINGKIYDFRLYDHALTADEVLKIYKGGL